jgi:hypothetical protein
MMKIHELFVLLSGNQTKIRILYHFISGNITAVRLVWRIRHLRGKQTTSLIDLRLPVLCQLEIPSLGFYMNKIDSSERTFRYNIPVQSSRVKQSSCSAST